MALAQGTFLGTYEIMAPLGAGGMGEVYLARDSRLSREVAIKILPGDSSQDPERLARFDREARLLASLNHPNIGAIYDLAESNGTKFFVLELVPGQTLADAVARGPVPVDEALSMCRQIADALEAAHEKGIIHRDLKPANIKITSEGKVKVLDFGLGKLSEHDSPVLLSQSPTLLTGRASVEGVIVGTAAYMSPEQARGKDVDRRTDIWSFGCVVFELLTGKQAFEGETVSDLFASILRGEPDWKALPTPTPESVRIMLHRCLQKDARRRLQHIGEARIAMEDAAAAVVETPDSNHASVPAIATRRPLRWMIVSVTAALLAAGVTAAFILNYRPLPDPRVVQFLIEPPPAGAFEQAAGVIFTTTNLSPDGRKLAFTAKDASGKVLLWVRSLDNASPQPFPGTEGAAFPFWSPDSRSVAFSAQGYLQKIDVTGGPPQKLFEATAFRGGTWNRDNVLVVALPTNQTLYRLPSGGGMPVEITKLAQGQVTQRSPSFLPDGRHFLYRADGADDVSGVYVGALDSTETKRLLQADSNAVYSPTTGELLFLRQGTLLRQPFDLKKLELAGDPIPVAENVAVSNYVGSFSVSDNGVLAYKTGGSNEELALSWLDRAGKPLETVGAPGPYRGIDLSPDGKRIAVHRHEGTGGDIWILESLHGPITRLTLEPSRDNSSPVWSPDGTHVAYSARQNGKWRIYQKLSVGNSNEELLSESDLNSAPMAWSPDRKSLVLRVVDPKTAGDESVFSFETKKTTPFLNGPYNELTAQISPDGKWIAYASNESGGYEIYVRPFPSGEGQYHLSVNGGYAPRWRKDGKELFFLTARAYRMASVRVDTSGSSLKADAPVELFDTRYVQFAHSNGGTYLPYAVSPDGQRFLIPHVERLPSGTSDIATSPITVVFNWAASIKR